MAIAINDTETGKTLVAYLPPGLSADQAAAAMSLDADSWWEITDEEAAELSKFTSEQGASIPQSLSPRQARLALLAAGLLDQVEAIIASMPGPDGQAARITWDYATEVRRDDPLLGQMADALGLTEEQIDNLFLSAVTL
jgi:hypothetical protein